MFSWVLTLVLLVLLPHFHAATALSSDETCARLKDQKRADSLHAFRKAITGSATPDAYLRMARDAAVHDNLCNAYKPEGDLMVRATVDFLGDLGALGRREIGPMHGSQFDLTWWEADNLTGALYDPQLADQFFRTALEDTIFVLRACKANFFPDGGTLIALLRYGALSGDLGRGVVDLVDKDIDIQVLVQTQEEFETISQCVHNQLNDLNKGWRCIPEPIKGYKPEPDWSPWLYECVKHVLDEKRDPFVSYVEIQLFRYFVVDDHLELQLNCFAETCLNFTREKGSVSNMWYPQGACDAYGDTIPCPRDPLALLLKSAEYTDNSTVHIAIPAISVERGVYHSGTALLLRRGLSMSHMSRLQEHARRLHVAGKSSFYTYWFEADSSARQLQPVARHKIDIRQYDRHGGYFHYSPGLREVGDPVQDFFRRFFIFTSFWHLSILWRHSDGTTDFANILATCMSPAEIITLVTILSYQPLIHRASRAILRVASRSPAHRLVLQEARPLELCSAYFVNVALSCDAGGDLEHAVVGEWCNRRFSRRADVLAPVADTSALTSALIGVSAFLAHSCKDIGRFLPADPGALPLTESIIFSRWLAAFQRALSRWAGPRRPIDRPFEKRLAIWAFIRIIFFASTGQSVASSMCRPDLSGIAAGAGYLLLNLTHSL
ncbi:unnamed protein product [Polarella glacialis]|uniref:Uncharacterized protein n=1 Tax=Polarella glacialis TaxID=89957 RepID=A0A813FGF2_POLGL|nr:unnamed protein product [Polarella glacialis]